MIVFSYSRDPMTGCRYIEMIPCLSVFSHLAVFSLENVQSSMYIFYVYFSDMASHLLGNNMSTTMWLIQPKSYLCTTVNTFAVMSSYVAESAACLHKPLMTEAEPSRKASFLTRVWRYRSRPSWLSNMAVPICELAYCLFFLNCLKVPICWESQVLPWWLIGRLIPKRYYHLILHTVKPVCNDHL